MNTRIRSEEGEREREREDCYLRVKAALTAEGI